MKTVSRHLKWSIAGVLSVLCCREAVQAQGTPLLQITTIQVAPGNPVEFSFADQGTGATGYLVEFSPAVGGSGWSNIVGAVITPFPDGTNYHVVVPASLTTHGFYRVRGTGGPGIIASFTTAAFQVEEGTTVSPTIRFSAPLYGIVRYTVSGTAPSGDYLSLTGEVFVNGTTATIPVTLTDNASIGQLRHLTLRLEAGPNAGYRISAASQTTITIEENDADWQGSFVSGEATLGFVLRLLESGTDLQGVLKGAAGGFFPTNEIPAAVNLTPDLFYAFAANIPLPPNATPFNLPVNLTLQLDAMNGVTNQSVTPTLIQGAARLITAIPAKPFLNTTNVSSFSLLRPPTRPSTNEVQLVNIP